MSTSSIVPSPSAPKWLLSAVATTKESKSSSAMTKEEIERIVRETSMTMGGDILADETNRAFYAAVKHAALTSIYQIYSKLSKKPEALASAFRQLSEWSDVVAKDELKYAHANVPDAETRYKRLALSFVKKATQSMRLEMTGIRSSTKLKTSADLGSFDKFYGEFMKVLSCTHEVIRGIVFTSRPIDRDLVARDAFLNAIDRVVRIVKVVPQESDDATSVVSSVRHRSGSDDFHGLTFRTADMDEDVKPEDSVSTIFYGDREPVRKPASVVAAPAVEAPPAPAPAPEPEPEDEVKTIRVPSGSSVAGSKPPKEPEEEIVLFEEEVPFNDDD